MGTVAGLLFSKDPVFALNACLAISVLYSLFLFAMSMMIQKNFYLDAVHQNSNGNAILTFDDGPHPEETLKILDILDRYQIKAMFFMIGKNVAKYPEIAQEVFSRGHQIGVH